MKQAKTSTTPPLRSTTVDLSASHIEEGEKGRRIASPQTSSEQTMKHPKGHKVRELNEIWRTMDSQDFLHLTDTLTLSDVWVQPVSVEPAKGSFATIEFIEMVVAPHIKTRRAKCKMSLDDVTKMLHLCDCIYADLHGVDRVSFEDWLNKKTALCVEKRGIDEGSNRANLCNYIITADRAFSFYPTPHRNLGVFFRKICYHSYKNGKETEEVKIENPSMIKCKATKGNFEYIIEARIFPLPDSWFDTVVPGANSMVDRCLPDEDVPATQPF